MEFIKLNIQFFGASNSASATLPKATNGSNKGKVEVSFTERDATTQNIIDNKTTIDISGSFTQTSGYWSGITSPKLYIDWWDNKTGYWTNVDVISVTKVSRNVPVPISGSITVEHNADGSLSGKARTRWVYEASSGLVPRSGEAVTSETTLATLPRTNGITAYDGEIGQAVNIYIDRKASTSETEILYSTSNRVNGTAKAKANYSGNVSWTVDEKLYDAIAYNGTWVDVTLTAITYIDGREIGRTSDVMRASIRQASSLPEVSIEAVDVRTETTNLTDSDYKIVKGESYVKCRYTASGRNGATISSLSLNGVSVPIPSPGGTLEHTFYNVNTTTFKLTAIDSRGFPNSDTADGLTLVDYFKPTIAAEFDRDTPMNGLINLKYSGTFFNGSFGTKHNKDHLKVQYCYKEKNDSTYGSWINLAPTISGNKFSGELKPLDGTFDSTKAYNFKISVSDSLYPIDTIKLAQDVFKGRPSPWFDEENMYVDGHYYKRNKETDKLERISTPLDAIFIPDGESISTEKYHTPGIYYGYNAGAHIGTPLTDGDFTLEVTRDAQNVIRQKLTKFREHDTNRHIWSTITFERYYSNHWSAWYCISGHQHCYNDNGEYGWYKIMTMPSTSGYGDVTGTILFKSAGASPDSTFGEISFTYYDNSKLSLRNNRGNIIRDNIVAIKHDEDNSVDICVLTTGWYSHLKVEVLSMYVDYQINFEPVFLGATLPEGTKYVAVTNRSNTNSIIYEGTIKGGDSVTLTGYKRFLDVYATVNFDDGMTTIKYTIDTINSGSEDAFGSGIVHCFDVANGIEYYMSECKFRNGVLTHTKIGYFNVSTGVYAERLWNASYYVYRIETYD